VPQPRQIFAFSGVIDDEPGQKPTFALIAHALALTEATRPKVCYVPTAIGDNQRAIDHYTSVFSARGDVDFSVLKLFSQPSVPDIRGHLLGQDLIFVEGGSVANLMAVWRVHGLREIMRECWEAGVVLSGASAGSICWHLGGTTDSFSDALDPFTDGIGLLPYSNGVHDDFAGQPRRTLYREWVANGTFSAGYATEDGVGLHYIGTDLYEAVTIREGKNAWYVSQSADGSYDEKAIPARLI
jgi:peptidase E